MRKRPRRIILGGSAIVAIALFAILFRGSVLRALAVVQRPLVAAGTWVATKTAGVFDAAAVSPERLAEMESQLRSAVIDRAELERLRDENLQLRDQLGFLSRTAFRSMSAAVVSRSIGPDASAFVIDRGADDGIVIGAPAISGDGIMVGKIVAVTAASASVRVISDRDSATAVTLLNGTRTIGVVRGMSGALLKLEFIPQDERVSVNDIVVTSGLEAAVPSGLLVGIVNSVETNPNAPFQEAVIEPLADVRRMSVVTILLPEQDL